MNKAVFLDRDGIIITERGKYNYKDEHIELVEGIGETLQKLKKEGFVFIVITNQGGVAKRMYSQSRVNEIHQRLKDFFAGFGVKITEFYFCPHHPDITNCICRKPDSLMLEKAIARYNIDISRSIFIGDNERDEEAGKKAGVKTLLIPSNADLRNYIEEIKKLTVGN
jgi:D-glycero-D-manno-heptose 1,7-bisphosphate phosphatase